MKERLENGRWGFESNCFVCETKNAAGLGIPFYVDADDGAVTGEFALDDPFSGAPSYVHGGVVLAVLDEAMAWAAIALAGSFAVTKETTTRFRVPVRVGEHYEVVARIDEDGGDTIACSAVIIADDGSECATAQAMFVPLGPAEMVDAVGTTVSDDDARYVRARNRVEP